MVPTALLVAVAALLVVVLSPGAGVAGGTLPRPSPPPRAAVFILHGGQGGLWVCSIGRGCSRQHLLH